MVAPRSLAVKAAMAATAAALAAGCGGVTSELPPHAEALVIVDTDLPVPQVASRLRVDLYTEEGMWFESRDIGRSDPRDWPASFSVFSDDDTRERRVLVRLRAYPEGITRDYLGERYEPRLPYTPPTVATSLADLCGSAVELPINGRLTLRAGSQKLTDVVTSAGCPNPAASGSIAARVTVPTHAKYHFFVSRAFPYETYASLSLRSRCEDPASQLACQSGPRGLAISSPEHFPGFDVELDPGTYTLLTTGELHGWPADITVEVTPSNVGVPADPPPSAAPVTPGLPRLVAVAGTPAAAPVPDTTPQSEPLPGATVDRLLALRLVPGVRGSARVTLRGACAGTMARLGADPRHPDPKTAQTCVDTEGARLPTEDTPLDPDLTRPEVTAAGTFGRAEECPPGAAPDAPIVCVPGGVFLFGSRLITDTTATTAASAPERTAVMPRFWMDRDEVTNKRLRDAVAGGLPLDLQDIFATDDPANVSTGPTGPPGPVGPTPLGGPPGVCTWSNKPMGREDGAVSCVNWSVARAFCQSVGGDLPTEAEWEYAASAAGRPGKTLFPWGDSAPTCEAVLLAADVSVGGSSTCSSVNRAPGPAAVVTYGPMDVTPLGIHGLAGDVQEWTLDSGLPFTHPCWSAAPLVSPRCIEPDAPMHVIRGGSYQTKVAIASNRVLDPTSFAAHGIAGANPVNPSVGFRCAYRERRSP